MIKAQSVLSTLRDKQEVSSRLKISQFHEGQQHEHSFS